MLHVIGYDHMHTFAIVRKELEFVRIFTDSLANGLLIKRQFYSEVPLLKEGQGSGLDSFLIITADTFNGILP